MITTQQNKSQGLKNQIAEHCTVLDKLNELVSNRVLDVFVQVYSFLCIWSTDYLGHSNITLATFEKMSDGSYIVKPIKQKQMV